MVRPGRERERRSEPQRGLPVVPAHRPARPHSAQASPALVDGPIARRAIAPSSRDTPSRRCGWRRCAATPGRSLTPRARSDAPPPAWYSLVPAGARSPRVQQTRDICQTVASPMARTSLVACRLPSGTIALQPPAGRWRRTQHPHSTALPQSPPRTFSALLSPPLVVDPANAMVLAQTDPMVASTYSSQPPPQDVAMTG